MTALARDIVIPSRLTEHARAEFAYYVQAGARVFRGSLLVLCSDETVIPAGAAPGGGATVAGFAGLADHYQDNTGTTGVPAGPGGAASAYASGRLGFSPTCPVPLVDDLALKDALTAFERLGGMRDARASPPQDRGGDAGTGGGQGRGHHGGPVMAGELLRHPRCRPARRTPDGQRVGHDRGLWLDTLGLGRGRPAGGLRGAGARDPGGACRPQRGRAARRADARRRA